MLESGFLSTCSSEVRLAQERRRRLERWAKFITTWGCLLLRKLSRPRDVVVTPHPTWHQMPLSTSHDWLSPQHIFTSDVIHISSFSVFHPSFAALISLFSSLTMHLPIMTGKFISQAILIATSLADGLHFCQQAFTLFDAASINFLSSHRQTSSSSLSKHYKQQPVSILSNACDEILLTPMRK